MKLLFVGYLHGFGGAEKMQITLANAMAERGHEVFLVSLVADNPQYPVSEKIKYKYIQEKGSSKIALIRNRYFALKKEIKKIKPDLTIHFWLQSAYFCAFMGKEISMRAIYAERGDPSDKEYSGLLGIIRTIAFKRLRAFVFQSKGAKNYFNKSVQKRSIIIHNPVFIKPGDYPTLTAREKRIVTVGRLHEQKNQMLLIDAFSKLSAEFSDYILEIYGDGELKEQLQDKIKNYGLQNRIFLKGTYKDIHSRIYNAALFVLTSDYEGMPNALLEAMALGLPCISTDCRPGGARELIKDGINGVIVPCGDVKRLTNSMEEMLNNQQKAIEMGNAALQVYDQFNPNVIFTKWEKFFSDLVIKKLENFEFEN